MLASGVVSVGKVAAPCSSSELAVIDFDSSSFAGLVETALLALALVVVPALEWRSAVLDAAFPSLI